nr:MAG: putative P5b protein [Blueberry virus L]
MSKQLEGTTRVSGWESLGMIPMEMVGWRVSIRVVALPTIAVLTLLCKDTQMSHSTTAISMMANLLNVTPSSVFTWSVTLMVIGPCKLPPFKRMTTSIT